jgi:hypothetical protein
VTKLTRSQEAAVFHGMATNKAHGPVEALELALRALELYEAEVLSLRKQLVEALTEVERYCLQAQEAATAAAQLIKARKETHVTEND